MILNAIYLQKNEQPNQQLESKLLLPVHRFQSIKAYEKNFNFLGKTFS